MGTGSSYLALAVRVAVTELIPTRRMKNVLTGAVTVTSSWRSFAASGCAHRPRKRRGPHGTRDAGVGQRVSVCTRGLDGEGLRAGDVARQADDPGQRRGVGCSLDAQGVGPVPGHIDHHGAKAEERDEPAGEDDEDLAARGSDTVPPGPRSA